MSFQPAIIITAAGRGTRAGGDTPKQWRRLAGQSVLAHSIAAFSDVGPITLVVHPDDMALAISEFGGKVAIVAGGETRAASVRAGLEAMQATAPEHVLIHDGARPLVTKQVIAAVIAALASGKDGAAPAVAITDSLWRGQDGLVTATPDRSGLFRAQTPQGFRFDAILAAHQLGNADLASDDVALGLANGLDIAITDGDEDNIKITWPADFDRADKIISDRANTGNIMRIGSGYDVHAFGEGDHVTLCGIRIGYDKGLMGHSDADVGMHALTDAIYGALAEGDIGRHFPPSEAEWKGADSRIFLEHAADRIKARGMRLGNADVTLICETPKIGPHALAMAAELASILGVEAGQISVKGTTSERLGFTGRGEGIAAMATVLLLKEATNG